MIILQAVDTFLIACGVCADAYRHHSLHRSSFNWSSTHIMM